MKKIDLKSLLLGVFGCILFVMLTSNKHSEDKNNISFVANPFGLSIYNEDTRTLYLYKMVMGSLNKKPSNVYTVAEDGSTISEISK